MSLETNYLIPDALRKHNGITSFQYLIQRIITFAGFATKIRERTVLHSADTRT